MSFLNNKLLLTAAALTVVFSLVGCEKEGSAERAGESVDQAIEDTGTTVDEAASEFKGKVEETQE